MIKRIFLSFLFLLAAVNVDAQKSKLVASCCDSKPKEEGRCTGSAYCSACSNCSRCAYCSSGGSCGVCAAYSAPVRPAAVRPVRKSTQGGVSNKTSSFYSNTSSVSSPVSNPKEQGKAKVKKESAVKKTAVTFVSGDMLAVESEILNLREEAGEEYPILEVLKKHDMLLLIALDGEWLQVKVIDSGNFGYVKAQYVYKI